MSFLQMTFLDSEPTIGGKTEDAILLMPRSTRHRWYKTILPEEKKEAMRIVDIAGRAKISASNTVRIVSEETRIKMRTLWIGENNPNFGKSPSEESRAKNSAAAVERMKDPENRAKISEANTERWKSSEYMDNHSGENHHMYGKTRSEETRSKISAARIGNYAGENNPSWRGGISFEPYCPAFDDRLREHIRNLYDRTCTICGISTLQNINKNREWLGRLAVDHLDENKMQGCDDWEWRMALLCTSCHGRMQKQKIPHHLLLQLLLFNNKGHQTNFLLRRGAGAGGLGG